MTNESSYLKIALGICIVTIIALILINYANFGNNDSESPNINKGLTSLTEFDVVYTETNTYAAGTVFVMQGDDSLNIKITADIAVGETDTGGISFTFTPELKITDVLCSFNNDIAGEYTHTLHTGDTDVKYNTVVEIARSYGPIPPSGGGSGMVIIDAQLSGKTALNDIESLHFLVSVGGKDNVMGIEHEKVIIPLLDNFT